MEKVLYEDVEIVAFEKLQTIFETYLNAYNLCVMTEAFNPNKIKNSKYVQTMTKDPNTGNYVPVTNNANNPNQTQNTTKTVTQSSLNSQQSTGTQTTTPNAQQPTGTQAVDPNAQQTNGAQATDPNAQQTNGAQTTDANVQTKNTTSWMSRMKVVMVKIWETIKIMIDKMIDRFKFAKASKKVSRQNGGKFLIERTLYAELLGRGKPVLRIIVDQEYLNTAASVLAQGSTPELYAQNAANKNLQNFQFNATVNTNDVYNGKTKGANANGMIDMDNIINSMYSIRQTIVKMEAELKKTGATEQNKEWAVFSNKAANAIKNAVSVLYSVIDRYSASVTAAANTNNPKKNTNSAAYIQRVAKDVNNMDARTKDAMDYKPQ